MRQKLTLSRETLRTLDDQDLSLVVGGGDSHKKDKHKHKGSNGHGSSSTPPGCRTRRGRSCSRN